MQKGYKVKSACTNLDKLVSRIKTELFCGHLWAKEPSLFFGKKIVWKASSADLKSCLNFYTKTIQNSWNIGTQILWGCMSEKQAYCRTHQPICFYVSSKSVNTTAQALVHNVDITAQLPPMVSLTHVTTVIVPTGALLGQLEERLIPWWDKELWEEPKKGTKLEFLCYNKRIFCFMLSSYGVQISIDFIQ